jgi:hypothetical protein
MRHAVDVDHHASPAAIRLISAGHEIDAADQVQQAAVPCVLRHITVSAAATQCQGGGEGAMTDPPYTERLRETLALKLKLRDAFTSPGLIEDNERQIRLAQQALRAAEETAAGHFS